MLSGQAGDGQDYLDSANRNLSRQTTTIPPMDLNFDIADFINNPDSLEFYSRADIHVQPTTSASSRSINEGPSHGNSTSIQHIGHRNDAHGEQQNASSSHQNPITITKEMLKHSLFEQLKLQQQVQQLQNQILQGRIDALNNQGSFNGSQESLNIPGVMTPISLGILPATDRDNVSPIFLQDSQLYGTDSTALLNTLITPAETPINPNPMSAPASIAFPPSDRSTPSNDFFSPLTSPALGPMHYSRSGYASPMLVPSPANFNNRQLLPSSQTLLSTPEQHPQLPSASNNISRPKRGPSPDEAAQRKRVSLSSMKAPTTKRPRASGSRRKSSQASSESPHAMAADSLQHSSPSPVDLVMPPPAPPSDNITPRQGEVAPARPSISPRIAPVTPASIMNLGHIARRPAGLVPPSTIVAGQSTMHQVPTKSIASNPGAVETAATVSNDDPARQSKRAVSKGKTPAVLRPKPPTAAQPVAVRGVSRSPAIRPITSPALKPLLPGGVPAEAVSSLSQKSNLQNILEGRGPELGIDMTPDLSAGFEVRKHSHKAAEQKRRDSLKAGFDDLRLLLPPITFDPDADPNEPPIPGSAPPRGPPRNVPGAEDHPNRGVSKLALLRTSNEYIVKLTRRLDRRDEVVQKMKEEINALKKMLEECDGGTEKLKSREWGDWYQDLDAIEKEANEERAMLGAARPTERARVEKEKATAATPKIGPEATAASSDVASSNQDGDVDIG